MQLRTVPYELLFKHPFGVSSNTRSATTSVFVELQHNGVKGYGEACIPAYLGETLEQTLKFLQKAAELLKQYDPVLPLHFFLDNIDTLAGGHNAAKAAVDIALHDLYGKIQKQSYAQMMGIEPVPPVMTAFTIGIDEPKKLEQKIAEAADFELLKIKAGTADDKKLIQLIRKFTDKPLYVDVNQGWSGREQVLEMLHWLKDQNVVLIEQPLPAGNKEDMQWLTEQSPIPTIADESVKRYTDLQYMEGAFHGINIKLMKSTGLREAMRMIQYCKKNGILILLGCMAESSCGASAMAQLLPFADFVDLDAPLLYKNDPFKGLTYEKGRVKAAKGYGIGAELTVDLFED
jgi:L-alanine-DL-glutamate epimerase-like enolase superfamily enzyme